LWANIFDFIRPGIQAFQAQQRIFHHAFGTDALNGRIDRQDTSKQQPFFCNIAPFSKKEPKYKLESNEALGTIRGS